MSATAVNVTEIVNISYSSSFGPDSVKGYLNSRLKI
jgi:hypothetical protein